MIRRFVRLQSFGVSRLHPGEVSKAVFLLLVLCNTAVGLAVGRAAFLQGGHHIWCLLASWPCGEFEGVWKWQLKSNCLFATED